MRCTILHYYIYIITLLNHHPIELKWSIHHLSSRDVWSKSKWSELANKNTVCLHWTFGASLRTGVRRGAHHSPWGLEKEAFRCTSLTSMGATWRSLSMERTSRLTSILNFEHCHSRNWMPTVYSRFCFSSYPSSRCLAWLASIICKYSIGCSTWRFPRKLRSKLVRKHHRTFARKLCCRLTSRPPYPK